MAAAEVVLVTRKEYAKGQEAFAAADWVRVEPAAEDEPALAAEVRARRCRAVIVGVRPYRGPLYEALAEVAGASGSLIARFGVGHDGIDKRQAAALGIRVTNTPGVLDQSVAEHALWLLGALARNVPRSDAAMRAGEFPSFAGIELAGKVLGIVGFGAIGRRLAAMAHFGLGMQVLAVDRRSRESIERDLAGPLSQGLARYGVEHYTTDVDRAFCEADVVSLHLPATPETHHFVDERRLERMRPSALLINTSRGSVVDEVALYDALAAQQIAGAALDVYQQEPYVPVDPAKDLRRLPNVVLTPHTGSNTHEANRRMAEAALANVRHFLAGRHDQLTLVAPPQDAS